jgi:hypothetical protein
MVDLSSLDEPSCFTMPEIAQAALFLASGGYRPFS